MMSLIGNTCMLGLIYFNRYQVRVSRPGPPLEIEKQKRGHQTNFKLFHLYFATFSVGNHIFSFSLLFSELEKINLEKLKSKKNKIK